MSRFHAGKCILFFLISCLVTFTACKKSTIRNNACSASYISGKIDTSYYALPNLFTPNGDGHNDILFLFTKNISSMNLTVYDDGLFGKTRVFESTDPSDGWDGTYKGKPVSEGSYDVTVKVTTTSGVQYVTNSSVWLLKSASCLDVLHPENCACASQFDGTGSFSTSLPGGEHFCN